jgi:HAD superfamily hydrolase (TIGR01509 family)
MEKTETESNFLLIFSFDVNITIIIKGGGGDCVLRTVLFDFDGTLADTLPLIYRSFREVFRRFGEEELDDAGIAARFGPPEEVILENHLPRHNLQQAHDAYFQLYREHHARLVRSNEAVLDLLRWLKERGANVGVVTGKGRRSAAISAELLGMNGLVDWWVTGTEINRYKPEPDGIRLAMRHFGAGPEETVYVGDTSVDVIAGKAAGVFTVGVCWFAEEKTCSFQPEPDAVFSEVKAFRHWLEERLD